MKEDLNGRNTKVGIAGLVISTLLMLVVVPYTVYAFFDKSIPFSQSLAIISGVSIILFVINLVYYRSSRK